MTVIESSMAWRITYVMQPIYWDSFGVSDKVWFDDWTMFNMGGEL